MSERSIARWTRSLIGAMLIGYGVGIVIAVIGLIVRDDDLPALGLGVGVFVTLVVLVIAAFVGGQALGRFGGLIGLALIAGIVLGVAGGLIAPWVRWVGIAVAVLAAAGFFVMGLRRRVPISIGGIDIAGSRHADQTGDGQRSPADS